MTNTEILRASCPEIGSGVTDYKQRMAALWGPSPQQLISKVKASVNKLSDAEKRALIKGVWNG